MAKRKWRKEKVSGLGCLVILVIGVILYIGLTTRPTPLTPQAQKQALDDRIRVLSEKEASLRQSATEYRAKAKAEYDRYPPEVAEANENMAREQNRHYGHKRLEGNARYADQIADETRREIERLKADRGQ